MRRRTLSVLAAALALAATAPPPASASAPAAQGPYEPTKDSLGRHTAPQWFEDAKLGFFVTWGAYSVPAYAPLDGSESKYAEWYWSKMNTKDTPTQKHHEQVWGKDVAYDDFLTKYWKAEKWNPRAWLDLFKQGGGKYYVFVAKHHDGIAAWDSAYSDRTTVKYGPKRDFTGELIRANREGGYGLKDGIYFSMPEWYNPASPVQWGGWFGRGAPKNPYTGQPVPYTGYRPVADYVKDFQLPQMLELVDKYDPDLVWCDIGGVNDSDTFMAHYFNKAVERGKEVTVNNRCGNGVQDFTTPEYAVEPDIKTSKWEASRGIGASYGYNAEEGLAEHLTPDQLVDSFVDVVSKNGNLLLNIGPKADGTVPDLQATRVRALGEWLRTNGEAVYGSRYWTQAEDKGATVPVRFTTQPRAFYVTALDWPGARLKLTAPVPVKDGDVVTMLGDPQPLPYKKNADGTLEITTRAPKGAYAYTFRIARPGYQPSTERLLGVDATTRPVKVGDSARIEVTLANRGDKEVSRGRLTARTPFGAQGFDFPALAPHARLTRTVELPVPARTAPGSYDVTLEAATLTHGSFTGAVRMKVAGESVPVDLGAVYDHDSIATADAPDDGTFGNAPVAFPADELPPPGEVVYDSLRFTWPSGATGVRNNVQVNGQKIPIPQGSYVNVQLLASAGYGPAASEVTLTYADGGTTTARLTVADWMTGDDPAVITTAHRYAWGKPADAQAKVYRYEIPADPGRQLVAVAMGKPSGPSAGTATHVFAVTAERSGR
ncbi:alpha-L-fucosidase [Nonomuraea sp. NPDC001831]|uniref:alpha-L-fucosidase n=1 Tax=Nonomuraea sp. NPDC001831 TaxID=3364340 RepID=UPI0036BD0AE5